MKQAKGTVYHMGEDPWWCAPLLSLFLPIPPGVQPLCWRRLPRVASLRQHLSLGRALPCSGRSLPCSRSASPRGSVALLGEVEQHSTLHCCCDVHCCCSCGPAELRRTADPCLREFGPGVGTRRRRNGGGRGRRPPACTSPAPATPPRPSASRCLQNIECSFFMVPPFPHRCALFRCTSPTVCLSAASAQTDRHPIRVQTLPSPCAKRLQLRRFLRLRDGADQPARAGAAGVHLRRVQGRA